MRATEPSARAPARAAVMTVCWAASMAARPERTPERAGGTPASPATPVPAPSSRQPLAWWGAVDVARDAIVRVTAGPTQVWVERRRHDWRVFSDATPDPDEATGDEDAPPPAAERPRTVDPDDLPEADPRVRFCFADAPERLLVSVAQADRPFVVRPATPVSVGPGERVTLFVSTPTWIVLSVERVVRARTGARATNDPSPTRQKLVEFPLERPSDTWFGPSTVIGELCYATRTAGYLRIDDVPREPHLALTPVTIENKAGDPLQFERVRVPLPQLAVYADTTGALWTNAVRLTRESSGDLAAVQVESGVPLGARGASERLTTPRNEAAKGSVVRAFSRLLHFAGSGS